MKTIYLIRHCKATGQEPEAELTLEGQEQAKKLSEFLLHEQIELVYSSPYVRAINSIKPLCEYSKIPLHIDVRLSERILSSEDLPDWTDKLEQSFIDMNMKLPGGESSAEAALRGPYWL
ncbi:histidine phosphatase family protein [Paenibacillus sp. GCM10023252]|uniref:histidine phosphatase family protein n=1 Tax=Paenibacillus sp. GCM10023252 TaxID=3252649 RepID=UPI003605BC65